jgi:hypothetical protein
MNFKESVAQDWTTFINLNEFAETIEIDDIKLSAVIIKNTGDVKNSNIASKHDEYYVHPEIHNEPLYGEYITVFFKTADYVKERGQIPKNLEFSRINGKRYKVITSKDEMGITRLDCGAERAPTPKMSRLPGLY